MNDQATVRRVFLLGIPVAILLTFLLCGCVRVGAGAGYWHSNPEGGTTVKQAGLDTAHLIPGDSTAGKITV